MSLVLLQLTIEASDNGTPQKTTRVHITINIKRNENKPRIDDLPDLAVGEYASIGHLVAVVKASDSDGSNVSSIGSSTCLLFIYKFIN